MLKTSLLLLGVMSHGLAQNRIGTGAVEALYQQNGMNYNGKPITEKTAAPGMEQPLHYWTPSISVCGIDFYEGDLFPDWKYNLFAGGLASQELHRLEIEGDRVVAHEIILKDEGRVRDVASGPDGFIYLVLNGPDRIARLVPVKP